MPEDGLSLDGVTVVHGDRRTVGRRRRRERLVALDGVSLSVRDGSAHGIVGESGAGKTTLLRVVAGLQAATSGTVSYAGRRLTMPRTVADRRLMQVVFQDPRSSLNPRLTVGQTLGELLRVHDVVPREEVRSECERLMELVGLPASALERRPGAFSGGQRQRVAIARALSLRPRLLLADEPVSALDVSIQASILKLLRRLQRELGLTILLISHDLAVVRLFCDQVTVLSAGRVVEDGPVARVFAAPADPYTRELVAAAPRLP